MTEIKRLLVANRGEIAIRVFRSAHELGMTAIALYTHEDRYALHRFHADEAYQIGRAGEPVKNYMDIDRIVSLARAHVVDAIHPGYGFLSENPEFARSCRDAGIIFVGPRTETLKALGDKTSARVIAERAGVPVLGGTSAAIDDIDKGLERARAVGFPVILKAAHGGGGRGMRVVENEERFADALEQARRESQTAFGSSDIFLEKYIKRARHIEVQVLGDAHGSLVHLYERDCSVQRRYQKVVEIAPAPDLDPDLRKEICDAACRIARSADYENAGTVEFLVDADSNTFHFIEVNPRIQVEHTVTEEVTNHDLVRAQILIAQGERLDSAQIGIAGQDDVRVQGFALQCRVTTEDPTNNFLPDYGRVNQYRSAAGIGIRLDASAAFSGAVVMPFYDSMLVKITARGTDFERAVARMRRALREFRVRGVKTNVPFLHRLLEHPVFVAGQCTTRFIDETPALTNFPVKPSRTSRILTFIADTIVNGNALVADRPVSPRREPVDLPDCDNRKPATGARDLLLELGPDAFCRRIRSENRVLITDTTFRDAHQSLLATRLRTAEMLNIADAYARLCPELFSIEMWGGATFDTAMRFLKECPWQRLHDLRQRVPNILFQMLLRASSVVGYANFPDNVVKTFVREAVESGMDVFRIFDALNWTPNMKVAMEAVHQFGGLCEAAICYSGDITNPERTKYSLDYYLNLARELEDMGAHILGIKDMAGLLKPEAARVLVRALRDQTDLPIHLHTHDTAGMQTASILNAVEEDLDIADAAMAPFSGGTSQPNLNTLVEALRFHPRNTGLNAEHLDDIADYWRSAREFYTPFESETVPASADLYRHEMPGGQYTNLFEQARSLGLADRWRDVCRIYADVNGLFGDIVKVTPTSKAVGDMALFMVANDLEAGDVLDEDRELAFPASVVDLLGGRMGQAYGGFPEAVQKRVLRGEAPLSGRPGDTLPPADFDEARREVEGMTGTKAEDDKDALSWLLYPKVYEELARHQSRYDDTSAVPTPVFFYGLKAGEEIVLDEDKGRALIIKYLTASEPHEDGRRTVFFEVNGQPREVLIADLSLTAAETAHRAADPDNPEHVGAAMPGMVVSVGVKTGDKVEKGQKLLVLEAMKMESTVYAEHAGVVDQVLVQPGAQVESGDLLVATKAEI